MIPPGIHYIYFSVRNAPRIGFFHIFGEREILVRKWDKLREDTTVGKISDDEVYIF